MRVTSGHENNLQLRDVGAAGCTFCIVVLVGVTSMNLSEDFLECVFCLAQNVEDCFRALK